MSIKTLIKRLGDIIFKKRTPSMDEDNFDDMGYIPTEFKITVVEKPNRDKIRIKHKG